MKCTSYYREDATITLDDYYRLKTEILEKYPKYTYEEFKVRKQRFVCARESASESDAAYDICMKNNDENEIYLEKKTWEAGRYYKSCADLTKEACQKITNGDIAWMKNHKNALFADFYLHMTYNSLQPGPLTEYKREVIRAGKKGYIIFNKEVLQDAGSQQDFFGQMKFAIACVPPYEVHYAYKKKIHIPEALTHLFEQQDEPFEEIAMAL